MTGATPSVVEAAISVLMTPNADDKAAMALDVARRWHMGELAPPSSGNTKAPPDRPARPERPILVTPGRVPRRRLTTQKGRIALLHAVAHIELNAIDLAFDLIARFAHDPDISDESRVSFVDDWIKVGADEARHFGIVTRRLGAYQAAYGDLPAHDGLWRAAYDSRDDLAARLAVAPMVLEARGLDVTPGMIARLREAEDEQSADALTVIYQDEIGHVAAGARWFDAVCRSRGQEPRKAFHTLVSARIVGAVRPPFNVAAREQAGVPEDYYLPFATDNLRDGHG